MIPLTLSTVKPDFESLLLQLQLYLQSKGTWIDLQTSGTGETLMEMMAAVGALNQFAIESAARETTLTTAIRDSSIYAITRMLGVRIHRKNPSGVSVNLLREDTSTSVAIPPYEMFSVNGKQFFNRSTLMFAQGSTKASERIFYGSLKQYIDSRSFRLDISSINVSVLKKNDQFTMLLNSGVETGQLKNVTYVGGNVGDDLFKIDTTSAEFASDALIRVSLFKDDVKVYEGTIKEESFPSDGSAFRQIYLAEANFNVSDIDVAVTVVNPATQAISTWEQLSDGIWSADSTDSVYYDSTSGLGETIIAFGDGYHGVRPPLGHTIKIKYASTQGASANNGLTNLDVSVPNYPWITGSTTSVISGGADEKPSRYYKFMAPLIFKARNRAVTPTDYAAIAMDYPGIVSASIKAQKDIAPYDLRWMNVVQMCLLPIDVGRDSLTVREWDDFLGYMAKKEHAVIHIATKNPTKILALLEITLALKQQYIPATILPVVEANIRRLFARQSDTLGRRIAVSDIMAAAMIEGVDYVDVNKCKLTTGTIVVDDLVVPDNTHFIALGDYLVNTKYSERSIYSSR